MKIEYKILPPPMPDVVHFERPAGKRQDGIKVDSGYDIVNFTKEEAQEFAELMFRSFIEHWEKRQADLKTTKSTITLYR